MFGLASLGPQELTGHRDVEVGLGPLPYLLVLPVLPAVNSPPTEEEARVVDDPCLDLAAVVVLLPADRLPVVAGGGDSDGQRLPACPLAGGHDVPQLTVGLGVQLVEDHPVGR